MFRPSVAKFFRNFFGRKTGTIVNRRPSRRLQVEVLEDRVTPTGGIVVTTANDVVDDSDGLTSLREAIDLANSDPDASVITFGNGAGITGGTDFTDSTPDTITLGDDGELDISTALSITGPSESHHHQRKRFIAHLHDRRRRF